MGRRSFPRRPLGSLVWLGRIGAPITAQIVDSSLEARVWRTVNARVADFPEPRPRTEAAAAGTVSAEQLRRPLPAPARQMLQKAQRAADSGDHLSAIQQLTEALEKFPESAVWIQPWLGVELLKTDQFAAAVKSFEQAVALLPRDAVNRSNFGLSLAAVGQYDRARRELRHAVELDRSNTTTKQLLEVVEAYILPSHD